MFITDGEKHLNFVNDGRNEYWLRIKEKGFLLTAYIFQGPVRRELNLKKKLNKTLKKVFSPLIYYIVTTTKKPVNRNGLFTY